MSACACPRLPALPGAVGRHCRHVVVSAAKLLLCETVGPSLATEQGLHDSLRPCAQGVACIFAFLLSFLVYAGDSMCPRDQDGIPAVCTTLSGILDQHAAVDPLPKPSLSLSLSLSQMRVRARTHTHTLTRMGAAGVQKARRPA